jgi:enoyl-CoA hydratase
VLPKAHALARRLADGPTWSIRWSKLAVNKRLKQQATLITDAGPADCASPAARSAPLNDPEL